VRIFVTGSADGLGKAAADTLLRAGHDVVVHARSNGRLAALRDLTDRGAAAVVGDLADADEVRDVAEQVNRLGPMDAVIPTPVCIAAHRSCRSTSSPRTC
jgi:NAD(P)-dependent dehydrogenase (short-subunit alcohol dehydrogenase family)